LDSSKIVSKHTKATQVYALDYIKRRRRNPSLHTYVHVLVSKKYDTRLMQVFCVYRLVAENVEIFLDYKHMY